MTAAPQAISRPAMLLWLAFTLFCLLKLLALYERPMDYDTGYFGTVARNVFDGYGYATSHSHKILFNPEITTGPAVVYPMAALMAVFGNAYDLPQVYVTVVNLLLFALFSVLCLSAIGGHWRTASFLGSLYLFGTFYEPLWWHIGVGDLQVTLVMLNAIVLVSSPVLMQRRWAAPLLGFLLAMGVLVKFSMLMALPALLVALLLHCWHRLVSWRKFVAILLVFVAVLSPFFVYKQLVLHALPDEEKMQVQQNALSGGASRQAAGIGIFIAADDKLKHVQKSFQRSRAVLARLSAAYGVSPVVPFMLMALSLVVAVYGLVAAVSAGVSFVILLAWVAGSFVVWYCTVSLGLQAKYTLQAIWLSVVLLFYWLACRSRWPWLGILLAALLPLLMPSSTREDILRNYRQDADRRDYRAETKALAAMLASQPQRPPLAYCGWGAVPRSVFYLLPQPETTPDCYGIVAQQLQLQVDGSVGWRAPVSFWLVRDKILQPMYPADESRHARIRAFCEPIPLFEGKFYDLYDCRWPRLSLLVHESGLPQQILQYDDPLF